MSKNNEEYDIEKIFQKAANDFPAGFNERDWQAMKSMLDQERDRTAAIRKKNVIRLILSLAAVLLPTIIFYLSLPCNEDLEKIQFKKSNKAKLALVQNSEQRDPKDEKPETSIENAKRIVKNDRESRNSTLDFSSVNSKAETPDTKPYKKADASGVFPLEKKDLGKLQSPNSDTSYIHTNKDLDTPKAQQKLIPERSDQQQTTKYNYKNFNTERLKPSFTSKKTASRTISSQKGFHKESSDQSRTSIRSEENLDISKNKEGEDQQTKVNVSPGLRAIAKGDKEEKTNTSIIKEEDVSPLPETRLSAKIVWGPDLSALRLGKLTTPGYSYGLILHYHINSKFLIGAGALKSTKKYLGKGSDYNIPSAYWKYATNDIVPDRVAGECAILEVPLDLQYNVMTSKKHNFYLSGGISSYLMLSEYYEYTFDEPNPYANDNWSSNDTDGKHLLNIVNFSVGYERTISQRLKLGIAPYVKTPIKGIGWSNVKFVSMGAYFSVRYDFIQKIKR